jgi:rSAM/selenodomain-associated transferase 2
LADLSETLGSQISPPLKLSVIVPALNEAVLIESSLAALQTLRAAGTEVILVDGGSADATVQLASPLVDRAIVAERGRARQMNAGAQIASGDVFVFLHADTRLPEAADTAIQNALCNSSTVWGRFDVHIDGSSVMLTVVAAMMNWRSRLTGIATGDQAIFVRRADFLAVNGFPSQNLMEDIEISRRLLRRSAPLCLSQRVTTSGRRWRQGGVWRTIFMMWGLRLKYWLGTPADKLWEQYK